MNAALQMPDAPPALQLTSVHEILARPSTRWIVRDIIPSGELVAIVGPTNCGKSFLVKDLMLAVARGEPHWFGHKIRRNGLCVHVTLEGRGLKFRLLAYLKHHKLEPHMLGSYRALETPIILANDADHLIEAILQTGEPVLICIDTVNRALGGDENSSTDMGAFLAAAERIKAAFPDSAVLCVHHLGKDASKGARGHSSFSANVGTELHVLEDEKTGVRSVSIEKQRDGSRDINFSFRLAVVEVGRDEDGEPETSCIVESCAPIVSTGPNYRGTYETYIYPYWVSQLRSQAVSQRKLREEFRLVGKEELTQGEVVAAFQWAVNQGLATPCERPKGTKTGEFYTLQEPKERRYKV